MEDYLGTIGIATLTGAAAATALYMAYSPTPMLPPVDIEDQSVEVPVSVQIFCCFFCHCRVANPLEYFFNLEFCLLSIKSMQIC